MSTRKAQKLTHMFDKAKRDKIKQTQDTWKGQFQETEQQKMQRMNIEDKYKDNNKERKLMEPEEQDAEQDQESKLRKQREYDEDARAQDYVQVDGSRIFVKGLDVNLLRKQRESLSSNKLSKGDFAQKLNQKLKLAQSVNKIGTNKLYREMLKRIQSPRTLRPIPTITQNTHYNFDINWSFGDLVPRVITKQPPRHHKNPSFPGIMVQDIQKLTAITRKNQQEQLKQQVQTLIEQEQESDNIFDEVPEADIRVGAKLQFMVGDISQMYAGQEKKDSLEDFPAMQFQQAQKRRKLLSREQDQDYYDQYTFNNGPSLQELKNLRKEGLSFYQFQTADHAAKDQKKEKKVNYNKEYQKIQRIIAQKQGKPK